MRKLSALIAVGAVSIAAFACGSQVDVAKPVSSGAHAVGQAVEARLAK